MDVDNDENETIFSKVQHEARTMMKKNKIGSLSEVPQYPPKQAGRSQTPTWVEIITTSASRGKYMASLWGTGDISHQPGWSSVALLRSSDKVVYYRIDSMNCWWWIISICSTIAGEAVELT